MLVCAFFTQFAHGTAGAARIRHSLLPRSLGDNDRQSSGDICRENADAHLLFEIRIEMSRRISSRYTHARSSRPSRFPRSPPPSRRSRCSGPGRLSGPRRLLDVHRNLRAGLVPAARRLHQIDHRQHHRHLDQHADHGGQRRAGVEAEQADGGGDREFEEVAGADQRRGRGDAPGARRSAGSANRRARH